MAPSNAQPPGTTACAPCRGSGTVISSLGGSTTTVTCPWCEGTGIQIAGHDAQAARMRAG